MNLKRLIFPIILTLIFSSIITSASAVNYIYGVESIGKDSNGDPIYRAYTNDPNMNNGKVRFWLYLNMECEPPRDNISPFIDLTLEGNYQTAYYTFIGYGETLVCVKAHFQGQFDNSEWSQCITIPWFTNLPLAILTSTTIITILKRRKKVK